MMRGEVPCVRRTTALLAILLVALLIAPVTAAPSESQLRDATLRPFELDTGMRVTEARAVEEASRNGVATWLTIFARDPSAERLTFEVAIDLLVDSSFDATYSTVETAEALRSIFTQRELTMTLVEPPEVGTGTLMYRLSGRTFERFVGGDCIIWRHEPVIAAMCAFGDERPTALGYALRQHQRLTEAFGP
jgi:hypothetical protein